jgi:hypothetical protein
MYIKPVGILCIYGLISVLRIEVNVKNANVINGKTDVLETVLKKKFKKVG